MLDQTWSQWKYVFCRNFLKSCFTYLFAFELLWYVYFDRICVLIIEQVRVVDEVSCRQITASCCSKLVGTVYVFSPGGISFQPPAVRAVIPGSIMYSQNQKLTKFGTNLVVLHCAIRKHSQITIYQANSFLGYAGGWLHPLPNSRKHSEAILLLLQ